MFPLVTATMSPRYAFSDGRDGAALIRIADTAQPCPGLALRLRTVIDCTPGAARMPPVTIDFLKTNPPAPQPHQRRVVTARFTCDAGDFVLIRQTRRIQAMVSAAGLLPACAPSVDGFLRLCCASAAHSFYKAVAVTVEAGDPGSILAGGGDEPPEDEGDMRTAGECAVCYEEYLVGGVVAVGLLVCGHAFHRGCIDRWTAVKRLCPSCRAPVPWGGEVPTWDVVSGSYLSL
ncbi:unnamed protein product [Urochloa decumbens]|uniref:RING-type domain-containing protein n=1 Tax=Urochloa decumbens TaxID=240449 RepID=A0ABC8ZUU4_9POAL